MIQILCLLINNNYFNNNKKNNIIIKQQHFQIYCQFTLQILTTNKN